MRDCGASTKRPATNQVVRIGDYSRGHLKPCGVSKSALTVRKQDFCWPGQVKFITNQLCNLQHYSFGRMKNKESGNGNGTGTGTSELKTVLWVSMTIADLVRIFVLILIFLLSLLFDRGKIHLKNFVYT